MTLYLVRHGEALPESINTLAPLSPNGRVQVEKAATFLSKRHINLDCIYHSAKLRAKETAEIMAKVLHCELKEIAIKPSDPIEPIAHLINTNVANAMMVSHLPFLTRLLSYLLIGSSERELVEIQSSSVACLNRSGSLWHLSWLINPDLIN